LLYRDFATQEELDAQYNLRMVFPDAASLYEAFCARESERVREDIDHRLNVPFGPTLAEHSDLYPARGGARGGAGPHLRSRRLLGVAHEQGVRLRRARSGLRGCCDRSDELRALP